jgi:hypothetical protein
MHYEVGNFRDVIASNARVTPPTPRSAVLDDRRRGVGRIVASDDQTMR